MILLWRSGSIFIISIGFHSWDTLFCIDVKLARWSFWIGSILRNDMGRTHFHFLRRPDGALVSCEAYPPSNFPITKRIACWGGPPWQPYFARNALWVVKKLLELWGNDWTISIRWGNVNLCMIKWPTLLNTNKHKFQKFDNQDSFTELSKSYCPYWEPLYKAEITKWYPN